MTPENNIGLICGAHSDQRHKKWQEDNKHTTIKVGDYAKMAFKTVVAAEHMWVKVTVVHDKNSFTGTLHNDPVWAKHLSHGEEVFFQRKHIEELL